jgi:thiosulfate/3-mercaptopyruvate sulfurtransferase
MPVRDRPITCGRIQNLYGKNKKNMSNLKLSNSLISVQFLKDHLHAQNLVILDASMKPVGKVAGPASETAAYIPGSLRFDFDNEIRDLNTPLPHMMPSAEFFTDEVQKMGINRESAIVVYDRVGIYSSPRAWWMFCAMGHTQVAVLDGGLPAWIAAGFETAAQLKENPTQRGNFIAQPVSGAFVNSDDVMHALNDTNYRVLDARSEGRFKGREPEPREGLKSGHMPNAFNIPYTSVLENGMLKDEMSLRSIFEAYKNKKMIFSCGSGATACVLALAADQAGYHDLSVYDGSWSEWGLISSNRPVVTD